MTSPTASRISILWPLRGLVDVAMHPRLILTALTASAVANLILMTVAVGGLIWYWPWREGALVVDHLARWALLLAGTFVILVPLIRGRAGRAIIHPLLDLLGYPGERHRRSLRETLGHVLRTLPIRILWVLAAVGGAVVTPWLGAAVAVCGIGHIPVLDALDHALVACAIPPERRRDLRSTLLPESVAAGMIAGLGFVIASLSVLGLLLWLPALFAGAARRVAGLPVAQPEAGGAP